MLLNDGLFNDCYRWYQSLALRYQVTAPSLNQTVAWLGCKTVHGRQREYEVAPRG